MTGFGAAPSLETKYCHVPDGLALTDCVVEGYASLFGVTDQGGDAVIGGAYQKSLRALREAGRSVKMLWQHDPATPIGVWDEVREDARGLYVRGRLLPEVQAGRETLALLEAGAIDGLSIGYRTIRAEKTGTGRVLHEIDLWEVSVVTFPMLPEARVHPGDTPADTLAQDLAEAFATARGLLA